MKQRILWQNYEDYINTNINICKLMMTGQMIKSRPEDLSEDEMVEDSYSSYEEDDDEEDNEDGDIMLMKFPITPELLNSIKLASNFECWVGHTNFNITPSIKKKLNDTEGVELIKVMTRYRFLLGIGKGFQFPEVRKNIREILHLEKEKVDE